MRQDQRSTDARPWRATLPHPVRNTVAPLAAAGATPRSSGAAGVRAQGAQLGHDLIEGRPRGRVAAQAARHQRAKLGRIGLRHLQRVSTSYTGFRVLP